jgi:HK97 family phage major capsid protein
MKITSIDGLRQHSIELRAKAEKILDLAQQQQGRNLTAGEQEQFNNLRILQSKNQTAIVEAEAERDRSLSAGGGLDVTDGAYLRGSGGAGSAARPPAKGPLPGKSTYREIFGLDALTSHGFRSPDQFYTAVGRSQTIADPRLLAGASPQREAAPSQGGFMVPEEYAARLLDQSLENEIVRPRAQIWPMAGETLKIPAIDGFVHTNGILYGGIMGTWQNELDGLNLQNIKLRLLQLSTNKLALLVNSSNELLEDASPDFSIMLDAKLRIAASWFLDQSFLFGTGAGQPKGLMNDPALITVPIVSGQTLAANPLVYPNITQMFARLHPQCRNSKSTCWIANSDLIPYLLALQLVVTANGSLSGTAVGGSATPAVSVDANGQMRLLTLPIFFSEKCSALGTPGDLILADWSQYAIGLRKEIEIQRSFHAGFTNDSTWFRLVTRLDGQGTWSTFVTPEHGQTLSWCVTLAART